MATKPVMLFKGRVSDLPRFVQDVYLSILQRQVREFVTLSATVWDSVGDQRMNQLRASANQVYDLIHQGLRNPISTDSWRSLAQASNVLSRQVKLLSMQTDPEASNKFKISIN